MNAKNSASEGKQQFFTTESNFKHQFQTESDTSSANTDQPGVTPPPKQ